MYNKMQYVFTFFLKTIIKVLNNWYVNALYLKVLVLLTNILENFKNIEFD